MHKNITVGFLKSSKISFHKISYYGKIIYKIKKRKFSIFLGKNLTRVNRALQIVRSRVLFVWITDLYFNPVTKDLNKKEDKISTRVKTLLFIIIN